MIGLGLQAAPSADPKMLTSSDCCSMMFVMFRVRRNTRFAALLTSIAGPSPLAFTTVFSGTRKVLIMARIVAENCGNDSLVMVINLDLVCGLAGLIASYDHSRKARSG